MIALLALLGTFSAHATTYVETYKCFNPAQMTDAPALSIVIDETNQQYVKIESLGLTKYVTLSQADTLVIDGAHLQGKGLDVIENNGVEQPPAGATVKYFNLVYKCNRVR